MLKDNKVPILLQDPIALMIHFILLLPVNVDLGKKQTINIDSKDPNKNTVLSEVKTFIKNENSATRVSPFYNFFKNNFS